ncbi:MAG: xanthine dehydrogenase family protein subunit M [Dehalococcoidia bacterium]|nr:xanthine dehydrogenase family protein subunit M [Dehalococcoidia bacterium]
MYRFQYFAPQSLAEAVTLLQERGDGVRLLAGGTDLLVHMKEAALHPSAVVSLHALPELRTIDFDEAGGLRIGAGVDMATIESHPAVRERYASLAEGAGVLGSVQTRNMATLGGNVANAAPSADTVPPLIAFDAVAEIAGPGGARHVPVAEIATGPGRTALARDEVLVAFQLPTPPPNTGSVYQRHTPRKIMDIAAVGLGIRLTLRDAGRTIEEARIALGAVAPTVIRAQDAEAALAGQPASEKRFARAAELAQEAARPISDVRGSAEFRRYLVGVITRRCLGIAFERAKAG